MSSMLTTDTVIHDNKATVYSANLFVENKTGKAQSEEKAKFIKTINQITTEAGTDAQFECEVEPFNCQVEWYSGNMRLNNSKKFEMSQRDVEPLCIFRQLGHKRSLTIKNCSEEVDQGQYVVKLVPPVGMQALDSVRIGHLRVGTNSPKVLFHLTAVTNRTKDLLAQWAEEMKRCQSIMTEMASCQRIYEQKAYEAEEKLRKYRKDNPQKGDGKQTDKDGKKGDNAKPGKDGKMSEKEIRQAAKAAVARQSGKAVDLDDEEVGRVGRKSAKFLEASSRDSRSVSRGRHTVQGGGPPGRISMAERGRAFGGGRTSVAGGDRRRSVSRAGRSSVATASQSEKLAREAAESITPPEFDDDTPAEVRAYKELEYQLALKDHINEQLQIELTKLQNSMNKAMGSVCGWQYDRMNL